MPDNILFLAFDYPPNAGGVAEYNGGLVEALRKAGIKVWVIAPRVSADTTQANKIASRTLRIGKVDANKKSYGILMRSAVTWSAARELRLAIANIKKVYAPDYAIVSPVSVWANTLVSANIPYGVCVHGADALGSRADKLRTIFRRVLVRKIVKNALVVFVNSNYTRDALLRAGLIHSCISTTYCGVSKLLIEKAESYRSCETDVPDVARMLTMSRLVPIKACDVLIEAVSRLHHAYPELSLTIAGDGSERMALENMVKERGLADIIKFLGYVADPDDKAALYHEHGLFVQAGRKDLKTDRYEHFGIVFAEAATFCRAAIGPRSGGVPEVIEEGVTGFLMEPDDADSLTDCIRQIIDHPEMAVEMGTAARRRIDESFNYDSIATAIQSGMSSRSFE